MRFITNVFAIASTLIFSSVSIASETGERVVKPSFFSGFPLGTIAWIPNSKTRTRALDNRLYRVLSEKDCYELPDPNQNYWFVINHRDVSKVGQRSFFSVRLLYDFDGEVDFLHLYRNKGWIDEAGRTLDILDINSEETNLSAEKFISLHDIVNLEEERIDLNKQTVQKESQGFHARVDEKGDDSWSYAHLIGRSVISERNAEIARLSIRNFRYKVTSKKNSDSPVLFMLNPHASKGIKIIVDSPGIIPSDGRIEKIVKFPPAKC